VILVCGSSDTPTPRCRDHPICAATMSSLLGGHYEQRWRRIDENAIKRRPGANADARTITVVVAGDAQVGKSSLIVAAGRKSIPVCYYASCVHDHGMPMANGAAFVVLRDASGCSPQLLSILFDSADAVLLCYQANDTNSMASIGSRLLPAIASRSAALVLVACKSDLCDSSDRLLRPMVPFCRALEPACVAAPPAMFRRSSV
jgi:hypothetical protein